ncbi:RluA family pseudouridine synthase [Megasphaera vaginalis (ex Srinivasan et al. 2021)]|uniref:Pseudouridine synthase n=1 Tax=Megasphaera vaginalis (ex Srinivasan et al. 2021) TaxID=1111454 RepID=U7URR6_9FIRM|nr:RluA family pseudouridine synthase [Megasphaera vaginalis (ex Srinivasan et al. 2021)]ERT62030.1 pseudouridine synthase, RluA family [Megasphaera vaginalis (ex Srinivasan et al. 2021)]
MQETMIPMLQFTVGPLERPTSLAGALRHFGISATLRRRLKHNGSCAVNGAPALLKDLVREGDRITVNLSINQHISPCPIPLDIAYEDAYLLVVNKPAGLLMHPTAAVRQNTLANAVAFHYHESGQQSSYHPMHRLDKNTSGLCLIAKAPHIQYAFDRKKSFYHRTYLAISEGRFPAKTAHISCPIGRCSDSIIKRRTCDNGKEAVSDFTRLAAADNCSLLSITLHTGRTHQIRVHSAYLGCPLAGDDLYGGHRTLLTRQALHAGKIEFIHPVTGNRLTVNSPLPTDIKHIIDKFGWNDIVHDYI